MKEILTTLIGIICILTSCSKGGSGDEGGTIGGNGGGGGFVPTCSSAAKTFAIDVNPIIQNFCNMPGCHASGSTNGPGPLTNYTQVSSSGASIRSAIVTGAMPQNATLTAAQKNSIICWIDDGTPNN